MYALLKHSQEEIDAVIINTAAKKGVGAAIVEKDRLRRQMAFSNRLLWPEALFVGDPLVLADSFVDEHWLQITVID